MARYGQVFKDRTVARLLPPESSPVEAVSRETDVGVDTLERWRSEALAQPARTRTWTVAARLEAVITTVAMDEAAKSAWCREQGGYPSELEQWRQRVVAALAAPEETRASPQQTRQARRRIKQLEREVSRKDKALAEPTAVLVLPQKLSTVFGEGTAECFA